MASTNTSLAAVPNGPHTAEGTATGEVGAISIVSEGLRSTQKAATRPPTLPLVNRKQLHPYPHRQYHESTNLSPPASISLTPETRSMSARYGIDTQNKSFSGTVDSVRSNRSVQSALMVYGNCQPSATVSATLLRREREVLDPETSYRLLFRRDFRRRDPARGLDKLRQDYIYYNHRSKGCYIPHEQPDDTMIVTYNHLFDFADGSRFLNKGEGPAHANPIVMNLQTGTFKSLSRSNRMNRTDYGTMSSSKHLYSPGRSRQPKDLRTVSVDISRSLRVEDLRVYAFEKPIVIESIIASDPGNIATSREGIGSVLNQGKLRWSNVPPDLQQAFREEEARFAAARDSVRARSSASAVKGTTGTTGPLDTTSPPPPPSSPPSSPPHSAAAAPLPKLCDGVYRTAAPGAPTLGETPEHSRLSPRRRQRQIVFTDRTDDVIMGFAQHVRQPVLTRDGIPSYVYTREEEEEKERAERRGGAAATDPSSPPEKKKDREAKSLVGIDQAAWQRRMETQRTYETSRLRYRRAHETERAAAMAPTGMTLWSTVK